MKTRNTQLLGWIKANSFGPSFDDSHVLPSKEMF